MLEAMEIGWIDLDNDLRILGMSAQTRALLDAFLTVDRLADDELAPQLEEWVVSNLKEAKAGQPVASLVIANSAGVLIAKLFVAAPSGLPSLLINCTLSQESPERLKPLGLTDRQAEILYWVAKGKSNGEISIILSIGVRTVETHVYRLLEQLGVSNRTEAANIAIRCMMGDM